MGWFFGSGSGSGSGDGPRATKTETDKGGVNYSTLDPSLREILEQEAKKGASSNTSTSTTSPDAQPPSSSSEPTLPPLPPHNPRYAHLWSTYTPPNPTAHLTPQEQMVSLLHTLKDRKSLLNRVALENCAEAEEKVHLCMYDAGLSGKLGKWGGVCSKERRKLERCVEGQVALLGTLGYMRDMTALAEGGEGGKGGDVNERIQMHADRLWQEQVREERRREKEREREKREGNGGR